MGLVLENIPIFSSCENRFSTHHYKYRLLVFQSPIPWGQIARSKNVLVAISVTAFGIGLQVFRTRDIKSQGRLTAGHKMFGWQAKTTTTNGVFYLKKLQFRIVETAGFSYLLHIRRRIQS